MKIENSSPALLSPESELGPSILDAKQVSASYEEDCGCIGIPSTFFALLW